ncbi:MAG: ornithine cyclodeaminase family protein [Alphaproteobacteria bacterium]|nr:ornithine cyclodeaminase family protein [Alphaproteobacteria bacterium]
MRHFTENDIARSLEWPALIEALRRGFQRETASPPRPHYTIPVPGEADATLLLMPAWTASAFIGIKTVSVFPGNGARGLPAVNAHYLLIDARNGRPVANFDAGELTARRTAAVSALASTYLSRPDARRLLVMGTGRLAPMLAAAHASVRPLDTIAIWGRDPNKAAAVAKKLRDSGLDAVATTDPEADAKRADIVSCATLARAPLVRGAWLKPGSHLDLVGAFTPEMREADDEALTRASVHVDTRAGAMKEAGEIVQAIASGALRAEDIRGDLFDLTGGKVVGRTTPDEITAFKSVGCSLVDLVAAELAFGRLAPAA